MPVQYYIKHAFENEGVYGVDGEEVRGSLNYEFLPPHGG
jgi:hypothetical protein